MVCVSDKPLTCTQMLAGFIKPYFSHLKLLVLSASFAANEEK